MISKLSDNANRKLLDVLMNVLRMDPCSISRMSDKEVEAIFLKLDFQHRNNCGVFNAYGTHTEERNSLDYIRNEMTDLELLT